MLYDIVDEHYPDKFPAGFKPEINDLISIRNKVAHRPLFYDKEQHDSIWMSLQPDTTPVKSVSKQGLKTS